MRVGVTGKLVVKMNIPVAVRNATTRRSEFGDDEDGQHAARAGAIGARGARGARPQLRPQLAPSSLGLAL